MDDVIIFNFICPCCGHLWTSDNYRIYTCPNCTYWSLVCSYDEGGLGINKEEYQQILDNVHTETKYHLRCSECETEVDFYFNKWNRCHCGGLLEPVVNQVEVISKIKEYRKKKKLTQKQMADKLGISQNYLSEIENGKKEIPQKIIKFITKYRL